MGNKNEGARFSALSYLDDPRFSALLAALGFSLKGIFVKLAYGVFPVNPLALVTLRMFFALPAFLWLISVGKSTSLSWRDFFLVLLIGFLGYYLSSLFDFIGLQYISVGLERLILFTYPSLVLLSEVLFLKKRVRWHTWAGVLLSYFGLFVAFFHDLFHLPDRYTVFIGGAWVFAACVTFASYYFGLSFLIKQHSPARLSGLAGASSVVMVAVHFLLTDQVSSLFALPSSIWGWAFAMALFSTALPIWLTARAVSKLGPGTTAAIGSLGPALTVAFGWIILSEPFSFLQLFGLFLVAGGVFFVSKP